MYSYIREYKTWGQKSIPYRVYKMEKQSSIEYKQYGINKCSILFTPTPMCASKPH